MQKVDSTVIRGGVRNGLLKRAHKGRSEEQGEETDKADQKESTCTKERGGNQRFQIAKIAIPIYPPRVGKVER